MQTALQTYREKREDGFTLIELLVAILITGILSAIAIPAFLNQRKSAVDSSVQSDVANAAKQVETLITKAGATSKNFDGTQYQANQTTPVVVANTDGVLLMSNGVSSAVPATNVLSQLKVSDGTTVTISGNTHGYCIKGVNEGGDVSTSGVRYASLSSGMVKDDDTCVNGLVAASLSEKEVEQVEAQGTTVTGNLRDLRSGELTTATYTVNYIWKADTQEMTYTVQLSEQATGTARLSFARATGGGGPLIEAELVDGFASGSKSFIHYGDDELVFELEWSTADHNYGEKFWSFA